MKKFMNKKGYTLTYVIVIIGLLLILTASVTFVSYYNLKTSRIGGRVNTSFYANDGALEEALTKFSQLTYNAEVEAWNHINSQLFLGDSDWVGFLDDIYKDVNDKSNGFTIKKANTIISFALKGEFEEVFFNELYDGLPATHDFYNTSGTTPTERYFDYTDYSGINLSGTIALDSRILSLLQDEQFRPTNIVTADKDPEISLSNFDLLKKDDGSGKMIDDTKGFALSITSDGTYHKYNKKVKVDLTVVAPDYTFSVAMLTQNDVLYKNEIANNALVSNENIVFVSGTTNIDGDIYAYGTFDNATDASTHIDLRYDRNRDLYGGVVIGYLDDNSIHREYGSAFIDGELNGDGLATANITGNVSTRNSIKMESDSSIIRVSESIYANGMYIRNTADDSHITILKNLYLYNDLYVAADNINITLGTSGDIIDKIKTSEDDNRQAYLPGSGEIWGLHDVNNTAGNDYTRLGSIIISSTASNPIITANGMFLYGIVRYDVSGSENREGSGTHVSYKTGESFTTFNNAQYYQTLLSNNIYQTGIFSFLGPFLNRAGVAFDLISFDALSDVDQVEYRSNHYFTMGYLASIDNDNVYKKVSKTDKSILRFRDVFIHEDSVDQAFYGIASNGVVAFKEAGDDGSARVYNTVKTEIETINSNLRINVLNNKVDGKINILGYSKNDGSNYIEAQFFDEWLKKSKGSQPLSSIGLPSDESDDITSSSMGIYNNDPTKDIYINFPIHYDDHINIRGRYLSNSETNIENLQGTIVSRSHIYIYSANGEVFNFSGNIISEKNIYLMGDGTKNISQDERIIYETIHKTQGLEILYQTSVGKRLIRGSNSMDPNFSVTVNDNNQVEAGDSNKITINYVSEMSSDGTSIVNSNSITIKKWTEID